MIRAHDNIVTDKHKVRGGELVEDMDHILAACDSLCVTKQNLEEFTIGDEAIVVNIINLEKSFIIL